MHDATKGKYEYIGDFAASLNRGPVKVEFGSKAKPITEKQRKIDEMNERNLTLIQRSMVVGTALVAISGVVGWKLTKWYYGVKDVHEFADVMHERMPKVSGKLEDSALGRKLQAASEKSRDTISENAELTDWRRSLRGKFNSPEGAKLARENSLVLRQQRESERIVRKSKAVSNSTSTVATATPASTPASTPEKLAADAAYSAVAEGGDEAAAEAAAAKALVEAALSSETPEAVKAAPPPPPPAEDEPLLTRTTSAMAQGAYRAASAPRLALPARASRRVRLPRPKSTPSVAI